MYWTRLFIPTLREDPAETGVLSHKLLQRAGYMRRLAAGHSFLSLGWRSLDKIAGIIREEMGAIGAQEFQFPNAPRSRLEELAAATAGGDLRSYKQLPQSWYQIQETFREEPGPRSGPARVRQCFTHAACSFDVDAPGLENSSKSHADVCGRILTRCGLEFLTVEAHSGARFFARSQDGDELVVTCTGCGAAASRETGVSRPVPPKSCDPEADLRPDEFHTPAIKTIAELAAFTNQPESSLIKTLVMVADSRPYLVLLRGDHQLSEAKFAAAAGAAEVRPAHPDELRQWMGADAGSLGPVGARKMRVLADQALRGRRNLISGANRDDYHLRNVTPGKDFTAEFHDVRQVAEGDDCLSCGAALRAARAVELGYTARLGPGVAESAGVRVTTSDRREIAPWMGSYGIDIEHILSSAAELYADSDGMCLPISIAPFHVVITPVSLADPAQREGALEIYRACRAAGLDALLDDRDERPGVKFKDADLVGIPYRITVGRKLGDGVVELVERRSRQKTDTAADSIAAVIAGQVRPA